MRPLDAARIARARTVIDPAFLDTPLLAGTPLDAALGVRLLLKDETVGPIGSFKGRGAEALVAAWCDGIPAAARPALVCASAGNFGQGLAWAGRRRGLAVTVFAATTANPAKLAAMRALGATVRLAGDDFDAAKDAARAHVAATPGARYVEDGAEPAIAEGAGTIGVELTAALADDARPDVVLLPVGNGALATGIGAWLRHALPATRVVGVVAAGAPSMQRSFAARAPVATPSAVTIADGIAVREPVPYAVASMADTLDAVVAVDDAAIVAAIRLLHAHVGRVVEPAGAAGVAALLASRRDAVEAFAPAGRAPRVASVLCGGNVAPALRAELGLPD